MRRAWRLSVVLRLLGTSCMCLSSTARAAADCIPDERLARAAAELLLANHPVPSSEELMRAVRAADSDAVGVHALYVAPDAPAGTQARWLARLRQRVDGALVCGRADSESGRLWLGLGRGAELDPVDVHARIVRGRLYAGFQDAELVVAASDGRLVRVGVSPAVLAKGVQLAAELALPLKVQLVARGPAGPRPVAEREVRETRTLGPDGRPHQPTVEADAHDAGDLGALVLALRAAHGRGRLRDNRLLRQAAQAHARAVCGSGRVAHELGHGDGPDARLARVGLAARLLGEAIARADGSQSALSALENSPSHLYTLLDRRFTDFGVGKAKDAAQKYCYVVMLCAWPRYVGKSVGRSSR